MLLRIVSELTLLEGALQAEELRRANLHWLAAAWAPRLAYVAQMPSSLEAQVEEPVSISLAET